MKKLFLIVFAFFPLSFSFAEKASLETVCQSLSAHSLTYGDFSQVKMLANTSRTLKSSGTFLFCDQGVVWHTKKPLSSIMVIQKDRMIQTIGGKKSVMDASQNDVFKTTAATISSVFRGDQKALEDFFTIDFTSGQNSWQMVLSPRDKTLSQAMKKIVLEGRNASDSTLDKLEIIQGNDLSTTYTFSNQTYGSELNDDQKSYFN